MRSGFTLVELSIVLAIIGVLAGGVVVGKSLFRASELRAVAGEYGRYKTAVNNFIDEYKAIPGDMINATSYWGDDAAYCADGTITDGVPGTCNGNGNMNMNVASGASATGEIFQFWKQLQLAGYIDGRYSGIAGASSSTHSVQGTNIPKSKLNGAAWNAAYTPNVTGSAALYAAYIGNYFEIGAATSNSYSNDPAFNPEEAASVDAKLDDGKPATGTVLAREASGFGTSTSCATSASATDYSGIYNLQTSGTVCSIVFINQF